MSDWNSSDDWQEEVSPRTPAPLRMFLSGGLLGSLLTCAILLILLRWPLTGRLLCPAFGNTNRSLPPVTVSLTPTSTISADPVRSSEGASSAVSTVVGPQGTTAASASEATIPASPSAQLASIQNHVLYPPNLEDLRAVMLEAINADRQAQGLRTVKWDVTATTAGQAHAEDMLTKDYFSHWNLAGYGPEHRYALVGGIDAVAENIYMYWYRYDNGQPAPIEDWRKVIREAEANLMDSPGHRRNILDPFHTHVGVGIAYDAQKGELRLTQEFINRWVQIDLQSGHLAIGDEITVSGVLLPGASNPTINLTYQPFPSTMTAQSVPQGSYSSAAEVYEALNPHVTGQQFASHFRIGQHSQKGLHTVRTWVEITGESTLASEVVLWAD